MDAIHHAEGKRHPHPPSRIARWRACLRCKGFEALRLVDHHQEVFVACLTMPSSQFRFSVRTNGYLKPKLT
jgi:hypothetical protein